MSRIFAGWLLLLSMAACTEKAVRQPYLQQVTPTSIVIVWRSGEPTDSLVQYGSAPDALVQEVRETASVIAHEVRLTGLTPNTRYYYRVGSSTESLAGADADHSFTTAPVIGSRMPFRLWVLGDSGSGTEAQAEVRDAMLGATGARPPNLFIHVGDMAYEDGTDAEFTANFFGAYASILRNTVVWPAMGNHEGNSSSSATQTGPYYDAYVLPKAAEAGGLASGTEAYYAFDYANAHFIALDSHDSPLEPDGAMLTWMKSDLAATRQDWVIAFWHHPPYSKGTHDSDTDARETLIRQNVLPILEAGGVDLVLCGHSHIYECSFLVDGAYDTPTTPEGHILDNGDGRADGSGPYQKLAGQNPHNGAVYVVAGHGGRTLGQQGLHPLMAFTEMAHGSGIVDINGSRLDWVNVRSDGVQSDHFTLVKGTGP